MPYRKSSVIIRSTKESPLPEHLDMKVGTFIGFARSGTARVQVGGKDGPVYTIPIANLNGGNLR